jgi:hypothetical protein
VLSAKVSGKRTLAAEVRVGEHGVANKRPCLDVGNDGRGVPGQQRGGLSAELHAYSCEIASRLNAMKRKPSVSVTRDGATDEQRKPSVDVTRDGATDEQGTTHAAAIIVIDTNDDDDCN